MNESGAFSAPVPVECEARAPRNLFCDGMGRGYVDLVEPSAQEQSDGRQAAAVGVVPQQYRLHQALDVTADHYQLDFIRFRDGPDVLQCAVPQLDVTSVNIESAYQDEASDPIRSNRIRLVLEICIKRVDAARKEGC